VCVRAHHHDPGPSPVHRRIGHRRYAGSERSSRGGNERRIEAFVKVVRKNIEVVAIFSTERGGGAFRAKCDIVDAVNVVRCSCCTSGGCRKTAT
jgi:hypothetical protein